MERPKVYLESSVISYLAARPSRDLLATAHQQITREWWERSRQRFDLFVSGEVLNEIRRGDPGAAELRLRYVQDLPVLEADEDARFLAAEILKSSASPSKAAADAAHIAIATVNGGIALTTLMASCNMGFEPITIVTPEELTEP